MKKKISLSFIMIDQDSSYLAKIFLKKKRTIHAN